MEYYIITGTGKGIGKALAEALLIKEDAHVTGISRHHTIQHPRYLHLNIDLSQPEILIASLPKIFREMPDATKLVLVNNAGVLGEIGYVGEKQNPDFNYAFTINVTAPAILMNAFLQAYQAATIPRIILNISSGAGKYPMDGWATYCASKAALDLFSEAVQLEQNILRSGVHVFSVAPGIVDTAMQAQIREAPKNQFSQVSKFKDYKSSGSLATPETVAQKLKKLLHAPPEGLKVVCRLDEI